MLSVSPFFEIDTQSDIVRSMIERRETLSVYYY